MGIRPLPAAGASPLSQVSKLALLLVLFLLAPLLPGFLRVPYFYLLFNVIVLALGVQAGLLRGGAAAAAAADDDFQYKLPVGNDIYHDHHHHHHDHEISEQPAGILASSPFLRRAKSVVQRPIADIVRKVVAVADGPEMSAFGSANGIGGPKMMVKETLKVLLKKCPSTASIFFLCAVDGAGGKEAEREREEARVDAAADDVTMSRQELFARTEKFLGNFRKQLRMQKG